MKNLLALCGIVAMTALAGVNTSAATAPLDIPAAARALAAIAATTNEVELLALWRQALSADDAPGAIARALPPGGFPVWAAAGGLQVIREDRRVEPDLVLALARAAGLAEESQNLTDADIQKIAAQVPRGDPARGELIWRRKDMGCMMCHSIGGAGGKVGPDLAELGARTNLDYIVESVLNPNKQIKDGYHSVLVTTKDGADLSGVLARETSSELVLRDANNKEVSLLKSEIESQRIGGSLMPVGVVNVLGPEERGDLFRFLAELGKPGPLAIPKTSVARVWLVNSDLPARESEILQSEARGKQWVTISGTVGGALLREDLQAELASPLRTEPFFAAARFQLPKTGKVTLTLTGPTNPVAWVDGTSLKGSDRFTASPSRNDAVAMGSAPAAGAVAGAPPATSGAGDWVHRPVTSDAGRPTGEGAGWQRPGRARSPSWNASLRLRAGPHLFLLQLDPGPLPPQIRLETSEGFFLTE